jgi:hypothetical protein
MHDRQTIERVLELHADGLNPSRISVRTGICASTVRAWVSGRIPRSARSEHAGIHTCERGAACLRDGVMFHQCYAYLLGMYLGDGCISHVHKGVFSLRVSLDSRYPEIIFECRTRMQIVCPDNRVGVTPMSGGAKGVVVCAYSKHWPCMFPQHGPGKKHTRTIELAQWQEEIVRAQPEIFLRGLIHSDGCRNINNRGRGSTWTGVRYLFNNRSDDIRAMFTDSCDQLGIHWTTPDVYTISVARRADTARLDAFIGPKQ